MKSQEVSKGKKYFDKLHQNKFEFATSTKREITIETLKNNIFAYLQNDLNTLNQVGLNSVDINDYFENWNNKPVAIISKDKRFLFANKKCYKFFEIDFQPVERLDFAKYFKGDFALICSRNIPYEENFSFNEIEINCTNFTGKSFPAFINYKALFDINQNFIGYICLFKNKISDNADASFNQKSLEELDQISLKQNRELRIVNYQMLAEIRERKNAELALKNSEKRFKDLFYSSPEAVFVESFEGVVLDINEMGAILYGKTREEMIGTNVKDALSEEDKPYFDERQKQLISGKISFFESTIENKSGVKIPVAVKVAIIEYNDNLALLLHARDITERKRHQKALENLNQELENKVKNRTQELEIEIANRINKEVEIKNQKNFLLTLIDTNPNIIFVRNEQGIITLANKAYANYLKLPLENIIGKSIPEINSQLNDKFEIQIENYKKTFADGEVEEADIVIENKSSKKINHFQFFSKKIKDLQAVGNLSVMVGTDVTEIKSTQELLKHSEELYRQIARNVPKSAIFVYNEDLIYTLAEGALVGEICPPKNQIEGKHIREVTESEILDLRTKLYSQVFEGIETTNAIYFEHDRYLLANAFPIKNEAGKIINGMVIILDITDLKKAELAIEEKAHKLAKSNEELEHFAYIASHDLQGPLRTITSYMQILEQRYAHNIEQDAKDFIGFSVNGAKRMQLLISDLLNYSRLNSIPRLFKEVNLNDIIFIAQKNLEANIKAKNAVITSKKMPILFAEPYQLTQLIQNILDNALKFMTNENPKINIDFVELENEWVISIQDNGIGIREEFKEKIFQIFQRLHTDREYSGTGIGLAICKKVVDLHHGKIWFKSTEGEGTTFYFSISKKLINT